jgi:hypothetical protein
MATDLRPLPEPDPAEPPAPDSPVPAPAGEPAPRDTSAVVVALELGWRLAVLYADLEHPLHAVGDVEPVPACLPAVETMSNGDQLEVQARAAASLAVRLKASARAQEILALADDVHASGQSRREPRALRARLRECHSKLVKELWFNHEAQGKAYELGTSIFDSWNRVRLATLAGAEPTVSEWRTVFGPDRVERIKVLLDDLQTQLPHTAVTVVKAHLDFWRDAVSKHVREGGAPPPDDGTDLLRTQTIIWQQLLTEAKRPEAFLKAERRREVQREFKRLVWRGVLRPLPILGGLAAVAVIAGVLSGIVHAASTAQSVVAVLGAIGISQASLAVVARDRIRDWTDMLWSRALADVVFQATLLADDVFAWKQTSLSSSLSGARCRLTGRPRATLPSRPTPEL